MKTVECEILTEITLQPPSYSDSYVVGMK